MAKSQPQQPTQTTTQVLSPEQRQIMQLAMPNIQRFAATTPQRYQGETVAGFTPTQQAGQQSLIDASARVNEFGTAAAQNALNTAQTLPGMIDWTVPEYQRQALATNSNVFADPGVWNAAYNPGMQAAIDAVQRPIYQQLTEQVLPRIKSEAILTGGLGGGRQGIAQGIAARGANQTATDAAAKMIESLYGTNLGAVNQRYATNLGAENQRYATDVAAENARLGLGNQAQGQGIDATLRALGLTPALTSAYTGSSMLPGATQAAVGEQQQALEQARINAAIQGWNYDQLAPFLQSKEIMSLIQGMPGGSTVSTANVPQANPMTQALGGAMSGAALGSMFGPMGTGVGALGGAVLPFLFS